MKTIVVGAGAGGIASALLSSLRGEEVTLIEGHSKLGGCASYFKRGEFVFDAGATTLSGTAPDRPLGKLFSKINSFPNLLQTDPGMVIHLSNGKSVTYHQDFEKWMKELDLHFPNLSHRKFWLKVRSLNERGWKLLNILESFPPSFENILKIIAHPSLWPVFPSILVSTDLMLKSYGLDDPFYREMIDGILIISAQAKAPEVPFLVGAMSLSYPSETVYPVGGMKGLMMFFEEELAKKNVKVIKREKLKEVTLLDKINLKLTKMPDEKTDRLILNIPLWNLPKILPESMKTHFQNLADDKPGKWGAFVLYFGIKSSSSELYHQIHLKHPDVSDYFVSFSHPDDLLRAPLGFQSVTISIHSESLEWYKMSDDEYEKRKIYLKDLILSDFLKRFNLQETLMVTTGSPLTFEHYTSRDHGFVGGLPWIYGENPLGLLKNETSHKNIYLVGDTIFAGQGIVGVTTGALLLNNAISKS